MLVLRKRIVKLLDDVWRVLEGQSFEVIYCEYRMNIFFGFC